MAVSLGVPILRGRGAPPGFWHAVSFYGCIIFWMYHLASLFVEGETRRQGLGTLYRFVAVSYNGRIARYPYFAWVKHGATVLARFITLRMYHIMAAPLGIPISVG